MIFLTPSKHSWRNSANCRGADTEIFYPPEENQGRYNPYVVRAIKQELCGPCPVRLHCLASSRMEGDNDYGIRGGLTPPERRKMWLEYDMSRTNSNGSQFAKLKRVEQELHS